MLVRGAVALCIGASTMLLACGSPGGASVSPSAMPTPFATAIANSPLHSGGFIALDVQGNVYLSSGDGPNPRISKLSPSGQSLTQFIGLCGVSAVSAVAVATMGHG